MRKIRKQICLVILFFLWLLLFSTKSHAAGSVSLKSNKTSITVGDEFNVSVNLSGATVATLTTRITVDTSKVEYVSGPTNTNFSNGKIIYTWTDPSGGENPKTDGTIATFKLKAKASGTASFSVSGNFYTPDENPINPSFFGTSVTIKEKESESETPTPTPTPPTPDGSGTGGTTGGTTGGNTGGSTSGGTTSGGSSNTGSAGGTTGGGSNQGTTNQGGSSNTGSTATQNTSTNANLKELHLSVEGLSPAFQKTITRYNLVVGNEINQITVNAIAEDTSAKVSVTGNTNLKTGINEIEITVTARRWKNEKNLYYRSNEN